MTHIEAIKIEGTPEQLTAWLGQQSSKKRFRLIEVKEPEQEESCSPVDPKSAASIALLKSWIAEAPDNPDEIRAAEEELREFKRNMNLPRKEAGARLLYPEGE